MKATVSVGSWLTRLSALHDGGIARTRDRAARYGRGARQPALAGERLKRGADRRALSADDLGDHLVGEPKPDRDAVAADAAPAVGQVPEEQQEPVVDVTDIGDRHLQRGRSCERRTARPKMADNHQRPAADGGEKARVENGQSRGLKHPPVRPERHARGIALVLPGSREIAWTDELGSWLAANVHVADHQAVEHQQPQVM